MKRIYIESQLGNNFSLQKLRGLRGNDRRPMNESATRVIKGSKGV